MAGMSWSNSGTNRFKEDFDRATMVGPSTHFNEISWTKRQLDDREGVHRKNFCGEPRIDHFQPEVLAGIRIDSPGTSTAICLRWAFGMLSPETLFVKCREMIRLVAWQIHSQNWIASFAQFTIPGPGKYGRRDPLVHVNVNDFRTWLRVSAWALKYRCSNSSNLSNNCGRRKKRKTETES